MFGRANQEHIFSHIIRTKLLILQLYGSAMFILFNRSINQSETRLPSTVKTWQHLSGGTFCPRSGASKSCSMYLTNTNCSVHPIMIPLKDLFLRITNNTNTVWGLSITEENHYPSTVLLCKFMSVYATTIMWVTMKTNTSTANIKISVSLHSVQNTSILRQCY